MHTPQSSEKLASQPADPPLSSIPQPVTENLRPNEIAERDEIFYLCRPRKTAKRRKEDSRTLAQSPSLSVSLLFSHQPYLISFDLLCFCPLTLERDTWTARLELSKRRRRRRNSLLPLFILRRRRRCPALRSSSMLDGCVGCGHFKPRLRPYILHP